MAAWGLRILRQTHSEPLPTVHLQYVINNVMKQIMTTKWTPAAVRRLRKKLGLTQEGLARRLEVSWVTVNRWERGHSAPRGLSVKALDAVAKRAS